MFSFLRVVLSQELFFPDLVVPRPFSRGGTPKYFFSQILLQANSLDQLSNLFHQGNIQLQKWEIMGHPRGH